MPSISYEGDERPWRGVNRLVSPAPVNAPEPCPAPWSVGLHEAAIVVPRVTATTSARQRQLIKASGRLRDTVFVARHRPTSHGVRLRSK